MTLSPRLSDTTSWWLLYLRQQYMINTYEIEIEMRLGMRVQVNLIPLASNPSVVVDMVILVVQLQHL